jgi:hypothetical protein
MKPPRIPAFAAVTLVLAAATLSPAASAFPGIGSRYESGQRIEVKGLVTDPAGRPLENVQVVLELARETFDVRSFGRTKKKVTPVSADTNARGEYSIVFPWDDFYNSFEVAVGVPVRGPKGERFVALERVDLTRRIEKGSPVVASVVVQNAEFIRNLRTFVASVDSDDERRVYERMGRPDRVKITKHPSYDETSWWYFEAGRVYRFVGGTLRGSEEFDPVRDFEATPRGSSR